MTTIEDVVSGRAAWCVVEGDCRRILPTLSPVDHVITDPPYDERTHSRARSLKGGGSDIAIDFDTLDVATVAPLMLRVTSRWLVAFCSLEMLGEYRTALGDSYLRSGIWDRPDGTPQISADRPGQAAEGIAIAHGPAKKRWNRSGTRGMWRCGVERVERHGHPTPKPIDLMLALVADFTDPGDLILDPFCGSGTTGVACLRLGRRFLGFDLKPAYAELAHDRLVAETQCSTLHAARAGQESLFR